MEKKKKSVFLKNRFKIFKFDAESSKSHMITIKALWMFGKVFRVASILHT